LRNKFNETFFSAREQHVCQQIGEQSEQNEQKSQFKLKSFFSEINTNRQSWFRENFTEDKLAVLCCDLVITKDITEPN